MNYVIGAIVGLVWGALAAVINSLITKSCIAKGTQKAITTMNAVHMANDLVALAVVYFLRHILPFSFEAAIIGTAVSLSLLSVIITFKMGKKM